MTDVTQILSQIEQGDPSAAEQLLPLVYDELRKLAAAKLAQEKPGQTLRATALVHERQATAQYQQAERERVRAIRAEQLAQTRYGEAQSARQRTRTALDDLSSTIVDEWLSSQEHLTADQIAFLRRSLEHYELFARENGSDFPTRLATVVANQRVGRLQVRLGQPEEAVLTYAMGAAFRGHGPRPGRTAFALYRGLTAITGELT